MNKNIIKIFILIAVLIGMCSVPVSCIMSIEENRGVAEAESPAFPTKIARNDTVVNETEEPSKESSVQPEPTNIPIVIVIVNSANIRSGPGTNYDKIGYTVKDFGFIVVGKNEAGNWYNIQLNRNEYGWIAASVVEATFVEDVGISATIPAPPTMQSEPLPQQQQPCDCSGDKYNCSSFSRQRQAQDCYNYCAQQNVGDIHGLDQDNDGLVCESLP